MQQKIQETLRHHGFRVTPQRAVILSILGEVQGHQHLTAQEVFALAQDRLPGLNVATVYRSLLSLTEAGLTEQMVTSADVVRFSLKDPEHQHCHLFCRVCNKVLEFESTLLAPMAAELHERYGFSIDVPHLTLNGICNDCKS
jgi:Fe2+ or Zn2+ uptake regulation protein